MRLDVKALLVLPVLATGIAAACAVIERGARDRETLAAVSAHTAAAEPEVAGDARPTQGTWVPGAAPAAEPEAVAEKPAIDFATEIRPLVEGCRPCHFEGGKMYAKLPFDDPATIRHLGEDLFTRIKDEEAREMIRAFLAQAE